MLYEVGARIAYAYDMPSVQGRTLLRLLPRELPGEQRVLWARLDTAPPPGERRTLTDFFGNVAVHCAFAGAHDEIAFGLSARVERLAVGSALDLSPGLERIAVEIAGTTDLGPDSPHHFLGPSPRIRPCPELTAYAREAAGGRGTVFETALALAFAIHRDMRFDAEATNVDTPPQEAFARRHGVCQDFAQIMIAGLRGVGVPAAYVSGYLRTIPPEGQPRLEGCDAMHAWVRVWCGFEAGWIELDPTNAVLVETDHIVVARGRDYGDVAPVAGVLRTAGGQRSEQAVDVIALDAPG